MNVDAGVVEHPCFPYSSSSHQSRRAGWSVWRVIWPGECFDQFGRTSTCLEPHAEQRNLPFTFGNGVVGPWRASTKSIGRKAL
ncbi:hypothetical protein JL101_024505 [Skermanella rosea]|uniref:hypothetical protein n=1 Tax=Skermanella rosea TaxID=1817965 RepID=UPI0019349D31|nr:hypothetical protein [Skermanella rosea]UEM03097.1 hypothetical protein JL101_024505 [Skermanella rosea]